MFISYINSIKNSKGKAEKSRFCTATYKLTRGAPEDTGSRVLMQGLYYVTKCLGVSSKDPPKKSKGAFAGDF